MKTARMGPPPIARMCRSSSKESTWRPKALRRTDVQPAERLLVGPAVGDPVGEHDHARAGPIGRHAGGDPARSGS